LGRVATEIGENAPKKGSQKPGLGTAR